jgi:hypothetical protein
MLNKRLRVPAHNDAPGQFRHYRHQMANLNVLRYKPMSASLQNIAIVQRLRRILAGYERAKRRPNRREAYHICMAIECLEAGRLGESDEALRKAEHIAPIPPHVALQTDFNVIPTVEQIRIAIKRLGA